VLLELDHVEVRYGPIRALRGISLAVDPGEIVALLGANGAGKSTTLRTISGLIHPNAGTVVFDGKPIQRTPSHDIVGLGVGHVPEGRRIFPMMTVLENLEMGAYLHQGNVSKNLERVYALFPVLAERRRQDGGTLSGGEQQMLAIGRALAMCPRLLMMDEPSLGLAPNLARDIFNTIRNINGQGVTVLLVEQNVKQALSLAHRAYVLENGALILQGKASELAQNPHVCKAYLGI